MALALRLIGESDLERVRRWRMLPEVTRYMYTDPVISAEDQRAWFARVSASLADIVWIIALDDLGPVGVLSLGGIDRVNRSCVWAYYLGEESARGKGLAKPLECNVADFVFSRLGLEKLCCEVFASNDRVVKLHERFGSNVEGVLREHIRKGGEVHDVIRMGLLRRDWEGLRPRLHYSPVEMEMPGHFPEARTSCRHIAPPSPERKPPGS